MWSTLLMPLWLIHSVKKSWIAVTVVLFSTQVKDNIRASWCIKRTFGYITEEMWWKMFIWMLSWTLLKLCAMLLATSLVSREKCTSASNQRCLGPWFLGLNSLEMVPVHYSSIKVILNMKELLDNVHRYKDNVHFSYDTCTGLLQRYGLSFGVSSWIRLSRSFHLLWSYSTKICWRYTCTFASNCSWRSRGRSTSQ